MAGWLTRASKAVKNQASDQLVAGDTGFMAHERIQHIKTEVLGLPPQASDTAVLARLKLIDRR